MVHFSHGYIGSSCMGKRPSNHVCASTLPTLPVCVDTPLNFSSGPLRRRMWQKFQFFQFLFPRPRLIISVSMSWRINNTHKLGSNSYWRGIWATATLSSRPLLRAWWLVNPLHGVTEVNRRQNKILGKPQKFEQTKSRLWLDESIDYPKRIF